jgi:hypothetical protein
MQEQSHLVPYICTGCPDNDATDDLRGSVVSKVNPAVTDKQRTKAQQPEFETGVK